MAVVYETKWFRRHFDWQTYGDGKIHPSYSAGSVAAVRKSIDSVMNELAGELNGGGWEIKTVIPLTSSSYYTKETASTLHNNFSGGVGYGAAFTEGIVMLCQRAVELSDEEMARRKAAAEEKQAAEVSRQAAAETAKQSIRQAGDAIRAEKIEVVKKGMFGSRHVFDGIEYEDKYLAEHAREQKAVAAEMAAAKRL